MKKKLPFSVIILFIGASITLPTGSISKVSSLYKSNNPPYVPSDPIPSDGVYNISICPPNLSWSGGDPDGDNVTYDVYFGKDPFNLPLISHNQTNTTYSSSDDNLDFNTSYYWQIIAWDEYGLKTSGPIWNFKTEKNLPPYPPSDPYPGDGDYYKQNDSLCWEGGDPNECDIVTYDVYFDDSNPPPLAAKYLTVNCWKPPYNLSMYKTYYWRVVAWDSGGLSTSGPVWIFKTGYPPLPEVEFVNPREGYFHFFGIPLFKTIFNFSVNTINIGGFKLRPIQVNGTEGSPDSDPIAVWLFINDEDKGLGTWNPETGYYEWQWTGWALGTYVLRARGKDVYGRYSNWAVIAIWNFCFLQ